MEPADVSQLLQHLKILETKFQEEANLNQTIQTQLNSGQVISRGHANAGRSDINAPLVLILKGTATERSSE